MQDEKTIESIPEPLDKLPITDLSKDKRNIIYVGDGNPATEIHGAFRVKLPSPEVQKKGFYHEQARDIIAHFPSRYKKFIPKGGLVG